MDLLEQQMRLIEKEIDTINEIASKMDTITQTTKNWAIVTWAGSIALFLGKKELRPYLILTTILPFIFLFIDAQWRYLQRRSIFRVNQIRDFFNDGRLEKSFQQKKVVDFIIFDPAAKTFKEHPEYKEYVSLRRVLTYPEIRWFYLPLSLISLMLGLLLAFI